MMITINYFIDLHDDHIQLTANDIKFRTVSYNIVLSHEFFNDEKIFIHERDEICHDILKLVISVTDDE